ncbi:MAG TPA: cation diffusion facilitator family transporter [Gemmatimonadaceae bacterium]|nr:cation diffusion facilitator family transporter [Gemmatimonadaceae bacterium]
MRVAPPALEMTAVENRSGSTASQDSGVGGQRDTSPKREQSNVAIYASIGANVAIAITKLIAAGVSGSSAMVAEGIHSLVDASDGTLLLVGRRRSQRPPDPAHPFGHGKELYFWTLIVAVIFFAVGGGVSIYEGILHLIDPEPPRSPLLSYVVLGIAAVFDGASFIIALRTLRREEPDRGLVEIVRRGKDPSTFTVVLEDIADLTGLALAFLGVWLGHRLANPYLDGVASVGVGLVLAAVALVLVGQSRKLLVGERASEDVLQAVRDAAHDGMIDFAECPLSMQLGPNAVLVGVTAQFASHLSADDVAAAIQRFEDRLRKARPDVKYICVEPIPRQAQRSQPSPIAR